MTQLLTAVSVMGATVFASRSESTALLQSQLVGGQNSAAERSEYLTSMKQQFMDYAKNGVPAEAVPFLNQVKGTLQTQVLQLITDEKDSHVTSEGTMFDAFASNSGVYSDTNNAIETPRLAVFEAGRTHADCRGLESIDFGEKETAQDDYDVDEATVRTRSDATVACLGADYNWRESTALTTYETEIQQYKAAVAAIIGTRDTLTTKISELAAQKLTCDGNQATFEQEACALSIAQAESNNVYVAAYNGAMYTFEAQFATWDEQSGDRFLQCQLVNTLICYIDALATHDDQADLQGAVDLCETGSDSHATCDAVQFSHRATPAAGLLSAVPTAPGAAGFDHGTMPAGTALATIAECIGVAAATAFN